MQEATATIGRINPVRQRRRLLIVHDHLLAALRYRDGGFGFSQLQVC